MRNPLAFDPLQANTSTAGDSRSKQFRAGNGCQIDGHSAVAISGPPRRGASARPPAPTTLVGRVGGGGPARRVLVIAHTGFATF